MTTEKSSSVVPLLSSALHRIRATPPRIITSPPTQPRRAAVAILIRVVPSPSAPAPAPATENGQLSLSDFFKLDWVNTPGARPEILFLKRESPSPEETVVMQAKAHRGEAHLAFPGGRTEADDEGGMYTALRQTWEEIGIDLAEKDYMCIGQLDDREITTSLGKRLLMILSPFVFLQITSQAAPPDPVSSTTLHWTPLSLLVSPQTPPKWSTVTVDAASRLAPKHSVALKLLVRILVGSMQFPAIIIEPSTSFPPPSHNDTPEVMKLWGLSLGMTLDLMSYMIIPPNETPSYRDTKTTDSRTTTPLSSVMQLPYHTSEFLRMEVVAPSLASVFPRFSYPDVNFWIWVFGKRYREVVRGWEASIRTGGVNDRRINWSGQALSTFYASIRKALVVVIVARALGILFGLAFAGWWIFAT
ncbi:hypothetical protein E1B28_001392 [Marasmius oreades]|uniref:Nudix hydrolase domain-containing protein n=1 Tax=Marasmius oreades TaxID=181124 RepID=A0A9P7V3I1_9AGAR|nr:uncharacterized protein E1B28_001392 [Marasmius oreades]KAG7099559.1 hypothetical protein E1B28_001392 [Marasmius oreades]